MTDGIFVKVLAILWNRERAQAFDTITILTQSASPLTEPRISLVYWGTESDEKRGMIASGKLGARLIKHSIELILEPILR